MKKKLFSIIFALSMMFVFLPIIANAASNGTCGDNVVWMLDDDGTLTISGTGDMEDYLDSYAPFYNNSNIKSVIIENGVTSIGNNAFKGCSNLTSITIPDSVTSIGTSAFYNTAYYNDSSNWKNDVLYIGNYLIDAKTSISGHYTIKGSTKCIGSDAFMGCSKLTSIAIPDNVMGIGQYAFNGCSELTSITIPDSVTTIGSNAFRNTAYYSDNSNWKNETLYIGNCLIEVKTSISGDYTIKDGTKCIGSNAFNRCSEVTSITIPDSVTGIGSYAFGYCSKLTSITIPNSVATIGYGAFYGCSGLTNATIGNGVTAIGYGAFAYCSELTSITIPDSVITVGSNAFVGCDKIESVYILDLVEYLNINFGSGAANPMSYADKLYLNNKRVAGKVTIPEGVTKIPNCAFNGCDGITSIEIPDSVTMIQASAFNGCSGLTDITIPNGVTSIGEDAFKDCSELENVYISDIDAWCNIGFGSDTANPMYYADNLYMNNELLTELVIPNSVTNIGAYAFYNCIDIISITIPDSVTNIGEEAFKGCSNLENLYISDIDTWCNIDFGSYTANPMYYANDLYVNNELLTELVIPNYVTNIGDYAFYDCDSITSITIPNSVTSIGDYAFSCCSGLTSVNYNAKKVFSSLFQNSNMTSVILGDNVTSIDTNAFAYCEKLEKIIIPKSVTEIEEGAFADCTSLTTVKYGGAQEDREEMYIGANNDYLKNATIKYNALLNSTSPFPVTTATVEKTETDTSYTFEVTPEEAYENCYVYAVVYDESGTLIAIERVELETTGSTTVSVDKADTSAKVKVFIWGNTLQPVVTATPFELV